MSAYVQHIGVWCARVYWSKGANFLLEDVSTHHVAKLGMKFHVPSLHRYLKLVGHVLEFLLYHDIEEGPNDGKYQRNIPGAMECVVPWHIDAFLQHGTTSNVSIC